MNNQDKVLLSAYLDEDLNAKEGEYIDKLLKEDSEALRYLNSLKELDNRVNSFFESSLQSDQAKNTEAFIQNLNLESKHPFTDILAKVKKFFALPAVLGYALSGALFFNIGTGAIAINGEITPNNLLAGFAYEEPYKEAFLKFRGLEENNTSSHIEKTLNKMFIEEKAVAEITYGSQEIFIKLKTMSDSQNGFDCFNGVMTSDGSKQEFLFCKSNTGSSLLFE